MRLVLPIQLHLYLLIDPCILSIQTWLYDPEVLGTDIEVYEQGAMEIVLPVGIINDD